jgi:hypothetical protein
MVRPSKYGMTPHIMEEQRNLKKIGEREEPRVCKIIQVMHLNQGGITC